MNAKAHKACLRAASLVVLARSELAAAQQLENTAYVMMAGAGSIKQVDRMRDGDRETAEPSISHVPESPFVRPDTLSRSSEPPGTTGKEKSAELLQSITDHVRDAANAARETAERADELQQQWTPARLRSWAAPMRLKISWTRSRRHSRHAASSLLSRRVEEIISRRG